MTDDKFIEDDRVTEGDARKAVALARRSAAIVAQSREVTVILAPGELHPRERIAYLEKQLAETEEERQDLAARLHLLENVKP